MSILTIFEGTNKILSSLPQLLREAAGICADRQHALERVADIAIDLFVGLCVLSRAQRNEDKEMNILAGFILDKGSYPWDVVS